MNKLVEQIKRLHTTEVAESRPATEITDIPISYEAITPEWMTAVLCREHPTAKVTKISLDERDSGSTNRRRIFLEYNDAGNELGLPESVFCKATQELLNRINLALSGCTHAEVTFFQKIRPLLQLETPHAFFATYDPQSFNSIIVLNDMGDSVEFCGHATPIDFDLALSQMTTLAKQHSAFSKDPSFNAKRFSLPNFVEFWKNCEINEFATYANKGFLSSEAIIPPRLYRRFDEVYPATQRAVQAHLKQPAVLLQGDCHLKQWYRRKSDNRMGITDWQGCCFGGWARDVAYAIGTSLSIENRRLWERDLLKYYLQAMTDAGVEMPDFNAAWLSYRQNMLPALAFWTVTLTPAPLMPDMQPAASSMQFIERLSAAVDDLEAIEAST